MKRFFVTLTVIATVGLAGFASIIAYIDPFFHYHKPIEGFPYVVDDQVDMNPGLARHMDYDGVLLGSSMTVNFTASSFERDLGLKVQKLSYNGAYPKDQANIMEQVFEANPSVERVFLGIDELNYSADVNETKYPVTDYLYDNNSFNDVKYLLNKDVMLDYVLKPLVDRSDATDWDMIYPMWWKPEHYNLANVRLYYTPAEEITDTTPLEEYIAGIEKNLDVNIIPFIEEHPDTEFTIFYPPYSILYWYDAKRTGDVDIIVGKLKYMTERLLAYDNVEVYLFCGDEDIITNFDNYADYTHYSTAVCDYMVSSFETGEHRIVFSNYESELEALRQLALNYPYEDIDL